MESVKSRVSYEYRPVKECFERTGKGSIGVKSVDTNKGEDIRPDIRFRLVATDVTGPWDDKLFAATPPIAALSPSSALPQAEVAPEKRSEPV